MKSRTAAIFLAVVCTLLPIAAQTLADARAGWSMVDFRAYYCAALTQRDGADPYYLIPMRDCEDTTPQPFYNARLKATVPAPYPPYALAALSPFTFLPFSAAAIVWYGLLALAVAVAAVALSRLTSQSWIVTLAAFSLSLGLTSLPAGNAMPLAVAALTIAAVCLKSKSYILGAIAIAIGMLEPNIVVPAAIGAFVAVRNIRLPLAGASLTVAALSLIYGGVEHNVQYITEVLPAHALSEVSRDNQYSFSTVVAALGFSDTNAVRAGLLMYVVMTIAGAFLGTMLTRRYDNPAYAVFLPVASALLGGSFVHTEAVAAAVPAAMLLSSQATRDRPFSTSPLFLLSVPWMFATSAALFLAPLFPVAFLTRHFYDGSRTAMLSGAVIATALIGSLFYLSSLPAHTATVTHFRPYIDPRLAESAWRSFVLNGSTNRAVTWFLRLPTWIGLILLLTEAAARMRQQRILLQSNVFEA